MVQMKKVLLQKNLRPAVRRNLTVKKRQEIDAVVIQLKVVQNNNCYQGQLLTFWQLEQLSSSQSHLMSSQSQVTQVLTLIISCAQLSNHQSLPVRKVLFSSKLTQTIPSHCQILPMGQNYLIENVYTFLMVQLVTHTDIF